MRRALLVLAMLAAVVPAAPSVQAAEEWTGSSTMLGGTARYDSGEWIYQDFVYDDYGADTTPAGASQRVTLGATAGDFRYPDGPTYAGNAADIAEVRVRPVGEDLEVRVTLGTLIDPSVPLVALALDTGSGTTQPWPKQAGVSSSWDTFVTLAASGADAAANTLTAVVPGAAAGSEISMVVGAGLSGADEFMAGSPAGVVPGTFNSGGLSLARVFDLAFNSREIEPRGGAWQEERQADALQLGDVSAFSQTIDLVKLRAGHTDPPATPEGFSNRIFRSRQQLGEGAASSFPQYRSPLQPYGLWIPKGYDPSEPTPLILNLHSLSVHHNQYRGGQGATSYFTMYEQLGDGLGAVVATPLARGPDGWYRNEALVDTLEVLRDVRAAYNIDPDRIYVTGYSMGGYGTYRLASLMPDVFAGAISWAGVPTDGDRLENLHSVPTMIVHGTNDELVPITGVRDQAARLRALGYEHRFHEHPGVDHFALVFLDEWSRERAWLDGRTRVHAPARVQFKVRPEMWTTNKSAEERAVILGHLDALGAELTSSYWVRDVVVRDPAGTAEVDATSEAIAARIARTTPVDGVAAGPPTPHITSGLDRQLAPAPVGNALSVRSMLADGLTVDLSRAGLDAAQVLRLSTDTDAAVTLRLDGGYATGAWVQDEDGRPISSAVDGDDLVIDLPAGIRSLIVYPA